MYALCVQRNQFDKNVAYLQFFTAKASVELVLHILGEVIKTARGNEYLLAITDRFNKLMKTVLLNAQVQQKSQEWFSNYWGLKDGPLEHLIADNGKCFSSKSF